MKLDTLKILNKLRIVKNQTGFTLIEVLISLFIFSMVIALAAYSFRFYVDIVEKVVMPYPEDAVMFSKLRDAIDSIFYYVVDEEDFFYKKHFSFFLRATESR